MTKLHTSLFALILALFATSCVDLDFDEPPANGEPVNITANATMAQLKSRHVPGQFVTITDSLVLRTVVVADDRSGNFYKTLIVQDETAGIELKVNSIGLFSEFPIGREVFIHCEGLVISDFNGLIQLGGGTYIDNNGQLRLAGIEETLMSRYLTPGLRNQFVTPKVKGIQELTQADLSTLVRLDEVQFVTASAGQLYADPVTQFSVNRTLEDCQKRSIILRSSGYADFAGIRTPEGKGSLTAVLGVFGGTLQLFIRDTSDVDMDGPRCGAPGPDGLDELSENFESLSNNQEITLPGWKSVATKGARVWLGRTFSGNAYVQATAFNDTAAEMEAWLITPAINFTTPKTLSFRSAVAFWNHQGGSIWVSTNYDGQDPATATWVPVSATLAGQGIPNYDWVNSGNIDLSGFTGKGHVAFRYNGSGPGGQTTTFIIDEVLIKNK